MALEVLDLVAWSGQSSLLFSQLQWLMTSSLESQKKHGLGGAYNEIRTCSKVDDPKSLTMLLVHLILTLVAQMGVKSHALLYPLS